MVPYSLYKPTFLENVPLSSIPLSVVQIGTRSMSACSEKCGKFYGVDDLYIGADDIPFLLLVSSPENSVSLNNDFQESKLQKPFLSFS